ncbi:MAG: GrpB family protein [Eubacteriaceae bacterium]|nr:GrpB family protein [Eubacteriaceae bacterium]
MRTNKIIVEDYNPNWPDEFLKIASEIKTALGDTALGAEHIGSTSVAGLCAKPIIDIDVIIPSRLELGEAIEKLGLIGYIHEGNLGIPDREAFKYEGKPHLMTHHLYVCPANSTELLRHIIFRDYLRACPEKAKAYGEIKKKAAELFPDDIDKYIEYKAEFIEGVYKACGV